VSPVSDYAENRRRDNATTRNVAPRKRDTRTRFTNRSNSLRYRKGITRGRAHEGRARRDVSARVSAPISGQ
jgi:hypothetical protein